jgi:hypothetical protein
MPPKKVKSKKNQSRSSEDSSDGVHTQYLDAQYNPDAVNSLLQELNKQMESKCNHIQSDADFMITSMQEAFHFELIKLPSQVKKMPLSKFKQEFGDSLEAVTRGALGGGAKAQPSIPTKSYQARQSMVFQTPMGSKTHIIDAQTPSQRNPKEGETILSANGSPLGVFNTVVKPKGGVSIIPPTPGVTESGVFVPLDSEEVIDFENIETLPEEVKQDALTKMQNMMASMQKIMSKLGTSK